MVVGVCTLDYLYLSAILQLDFSQTQVELYNARGAQVVKDSHANQH